MERHPCFHISSDLAGPSKCPATAPVRTLSECWCILSPSAPSSHGMVMANGRTFIPEWKNGDLVKTGPGSGEMLEARIVSVEVDGEQCCTTPLLCVKDMPCQFTPKKTILANLRVTERCLLKDSEQQPMEQRFKNSNWLWFEALFAELLLRIGVWF